ncbi:MAG: GNAT family N-acetyltransferase [Bacilli bacterium]
MFYTETMIKLAQQEDLGALKDYLGNEDPWTLFFYGDLYNYSIDSKKAKFYLGIKDKKISYLVLVFRNTLLQFYSRDENYDFEEAKAFLLSQKISVLSGKEDLLEPFLKFFPPKKLESTYLSVITKISQAPDFQLKEGFSIREITTKEEFRVYVRFLSEIKEFHSNSKSLNEDVESYFQEYEKGCHFIGVFNEKGELVSTVGSSADNDVSAMIVGVATLPSYRKLGLASLALYQLVKKEFGLGKKYLALFYDNPLAGKIYHNLGFREIGKYGMLR